MAATLKSQTREEPTAEAIASDDLLTGIGLGDRIKKLRLKRSMGLVELGRRTGLSASFLSQLETGRVVPTLRNLSRISIVFGKDISYFFEAGGGSSKKTFRVQRKSTRVRLPMGANLADYISESFGILIPEGGLRPCMAEFLPGEERQPFLPEKYPGIEMVYVISGSLQLKKKGEVHILCPRDVCYISGDSPRSYRCVSDEPAKVLIISFDAEQGALRRLRKVPQTVVP